MFGEESFWFDVHLMNCPSARFARPRLLKHCEPKTEAEPNPDMILISEDDFSPKILQSCYWHTLRRFTQQGQCQMRLSSGFVSRFDTLF
jgi:hypothetical protein